MSLNISFCNQPDLKPRLCVFGVGGAGGNAVNNMINAGLEGVDFWIANTDAQALEHSLTSNRIQLGVNSTMGLGAGSYPEVGNDAAEESIEEIASALQSYNMVFITAGMGGGTGTGAAPVVARVAREMNILSVGVVTKPFHFEGARRMKVADKGLEEMQKYVDTLIVIPNQNLFRIANEKTTFADAFKAADEVLHSGVRGITDLITMPGLINLDFADIRTVVSEMGKAMMGTGEAEGEHRAIRAAEAAISNPLLDHSSMKGARAVLINITGGVDMTLYEVDEAANRIKEEAPDATIIFGSAFNSNLQGKLRVSVVATGIDAGVSAPKTVEVPEEVPSVIFEEKITINHPETLGDELISELEQAFIPAQTTEPDFSSAPFSQEEKEHDEKQIPPHQATSQSILGKMAATFGIYNRKSPEGPIGDDKKDMFEIPAFMRRKNKDL